MVQSKRALYLTRIPKRPTHALPQNVFSSAPTVLAGHIICCVVAVFVFSKLLSINYTVVYLCVLTEYRVIYSVQCYPWIRLIAVCLEFITHGYGAILYIVKNS
jgi:hypothetical protein